MPKLPRWTAIEAESALLRAGFDHLRSKGSHRIYGKGELRVIVPFHSGTTLHPKVVKQVLEVMEEAGRTPGHSDKSP
jgi:predicted RNA binding protein YcfA (HicA-like mRNA interferase family)